MKMEVSATSGKPEIHCSFCNKSQNEVRKLIAGPSVNICDECVETCIDIMADDAAKSEVVSTANETGQLLGRACALCGFPVLVEEALPVVERGFLCRGCVDAIEAAVAEQKLSE